MSTILYVVNNLYVKRYGGRCITIQVDDSLGEFTIFHGPQRLSYVSDYIIRFSQGKKPEYLKNRSYHKEPYNEKQLAWMLLKAKNGTVKTN